jgi:hypothetical protein
MINFIKKHRSKAAKICGIVLFTLLMSVNLIITTNSSRSGDIDLFGVKLSLSTTSAYAADESSYCYYWSKNWRECLRPASNCLCDIIVNP